ncbi:Arylsulfatase [Pontiella desulfatans]|uniref:Arylsulfatase n=1 Tax=Pontiella desulfatans TaxID=2750659 RepID=A0A6C2TVT7_PONDE|nr:arylsulfatase [Pontiella desulfatans]SPS73608.1 sulfatase S1_15 [Kiritimatiellales bacterium]VGO11713.1 Arylsulfatase [Pontiella desulfatans]
MKRMLFSAAVALALSAAAANQPNVIVILADDMGSGDIRALNPDSAIPTPNLDRLSAEGATFTAAHSGSAVCTPTRYGLVTGRYCWRSRLKKGVLNGYSGHLIEPERFTIADLFRSKGYATACFGKWHLGMDLPMSGKNKLDLAGKVENGPLANGFDRFYGITASLDFPPYVFICDDKIDAPAVERKPSRRFPEFLRAGETGTNFEHENVQDQLVETTTAFIREKAAAGEPFFIYLPLPSPHKPVLPAGRFRGKSAIGPYGDYVMQTDGSVGEVLKAVRESGIDENTMIVYTSDNGSFMFRLDAPECPPQMPADSNNPKNGSDHKSDPTIQGFNSASHRANLNYRGTKADIFEGGHRVPFLVRIPGTVEGGRRISSTISLVDILATCADLLGAEVPDGAAEDSFSFLPLLTGEGTHERAPVVAHSVNGCFALYSGPWKFIATKGSGGRTLPKSTPFEKPYQLYDLSNDIVERNNLIDAHPELAQRLENELMAMIGSALQKPAIP